MLPLAGWYAWHYAKTGFLFGNPEFLRYNAEATLTPLRILAAFGHRVLHLTAHMNLFVPVLMTLAALMLNPRPDAEGHERPAISSAALWRILILLLANAVLFSVLGGALLTRYLLPMYPLVLLVAVTTFYRRVPYWQALAVFSAAAFVVGLFINPPYRLCAGRQPGLCARDPAAPGRDCAAEQALSRRDGAFGVAGDRRTDPAGTGLREDSPTTFTGSTTSPRRRSTAPPRSRRSTRRRWSFRPSTIRRRCP